MATEKPTRHKKFTRSEDGSEKDWPGINFPATFSVATFVKSKPRHASPGNERNTLLPALAHCCPISICLLFALLAPPAAVLFAAGTDAHPATFYVAPNGNDAWSGQKPSPTLFRTDGPFATVPRGLKAAREFLAARSGSTATVVLRAGTWFLEEPLVLTPADSGLSICAYQSETAVLSGGRRISGWRPVTVAGRTAWAAPAQAPGRHSWNFRELWVNGRRAVRARHPNHGYLAVAGLPDKTKSWTQGQSRFSFSGADLRSGKTLTNAEVVVMSRWVESRLPIASVDQKERLVAFRKRAVYDLAPGDLYYVEGALEFLDTPGEWWLDPIGMVYYLPRPGETVDKVEAVAPWLSQVVRLEGHPETNRFVQNVSFRGVTFSHSEWSFPETVLSPNTNSEMETGGSIQAAVSVSGSVWGEGVRFSTFERCRFVALGNYGLELGRGCEGNRISYCEFGDLGAGGIKLGETEIRSNPAEQTRGNEISDCHIHDGGQIFQSAVGIWIGQSPNNEVAHNLIQDFYYTGISIGWSWGYGPALAPNNLVAFNHVHHIGIKSNGDGPVLSDMGGIYTLGRQPGTRILNNLWHDIAGLRYGGWGIYFDEGSSSIVAASNVVYRTTHGGFHQHYGATNQVVNNIFALGRDLQVQRTRSEAHISFYFQTNIVWFTSGILFGGDWSNDHYVMDYNLYFDARPGSVPWEMRFAGVSLEDWRKRGHDLHSRIADPSFVAPFRDDFALRPDSPALKLGFHPIQLQDVGIRPPAKP